MKLACVSFEVERDVTAGSLCIVRFVLLPDRRLFFSRGLLKKIIMYMYLMMEIRRGLYKYRLLQLA